jgi:hypothetical protein
MGAKTTFYGTLQGTAVNAVQALLAETATIIDAGATPPVISPVPFNPFNISLVDKAPTSAIAPAILSSSTYGAKNISVDPGNLIKDAQSRARYSGLLNHEPNIHEIRQLLRRVGTSSSLAAQLSNEEKISRKFADAIPASEKIERAVGPQPTSKFGYEAIGNNAIENRSKRFIPAER